MRVILRPAAKAPRFTLPTSKNLRITRMLLEMFCLLNVSLVYENFNSLKTHKKDAMMSFLPLHADTVAVSVPNIELCCDLKTFLTRN